MTKAKGSGRSDRLWKRYLLKNGAIVMIHKPSLLKKLGKPVMVKLGPIKDIGMRGLAVQYVDQKNILRNVDELSIAFPDGQVVIDGLKFKSITDFEIAKMPDDREIRTLCVNFTNMLPAQKMQLEQFIDEYATEMVDDRCVSKAGSTAAAKPKKRKRAKSPG